MGPWTEYRYRGAVMEESGHPNVDNSEYSSIASKPQDHSGDKGRVRMVLVPLGLLCIQIINAIYNVLASTALTKDGANPLVFSVYRDAFAWPVLHVSALFVDGFIFPQLNDWSRFFLQGLFGVFGNQVLFLYGMKLTSATFASIVHQAIPIFTFAIEVTLGRETPTLATFGGLAVAVSGAIIMSLDDEGGFGGGEGHNIHGWLVLLAGCLVMALYFIIQKTTLNKGYPPLTVTAWEYLIGLVTIGAVASGVADSASSWRLSKKAWIALGFAASFNSVGKYALSTTCNKFVSATILTIFSTLVPVFTAALEWIFVNSEPKWQHLGAIPVIIGTVVIKYTKSSVRQAKSPNSEDIESEFLLGHENGNGHANGAR